MISLLELVVELDPEQAVLEVLHELLVVNPASAINIGCQSKSHDLLLVKAKGPEIGQALDVLERLKETFVVSIKLAENLEQVKISVLGHGHMSFPESAQLHQLSLSSTGFN